MLGLFLSLAPAGLLLSTANTAALDLPFATSTIRTSSEISRRSAVSRGVAAAASPLLFPLAAPASVSSSSVGGETVSLLNSASKKKKAFPLASFGLQVYDDDTAYRLTITALEVGYRNFFASVLAGNQKGFARAVKDSGVPRDELYICGSVLSNRANGEQAAYQKTKQGCLENMKAMAAGNIDKLDMIMLDYPGPNEESIRGQWRALEDMLAEDRTVDDLAVSNFSPAQLDTILVNNPGLVTKPTVNQLPYSLAYNPPGLLEYNAKRDVLVQSWSPLSRVLPRYEKTLQTIGKNHGKSAAQVGLRWILQNGAAFTTQTKSKQHFEEDLNVFDFALTENEMLTLNKLSA